MTLAMPFPRRTLRRGQHILSLGLLNAQPRPAFLSSDIDVASKPEQIMV